MAKRDLSFLDGKTLLVTGGTGSFGQRFTEVVLKESRIAALRVYSRDELKQHHMREHVPDERLRFLIGDVRDRDRLYRAMHGVDYVVHAAALKQVPACEYNPFEAVKTNILGAVNVIDAAIDSGVQRVIALSSDKAVNPVNLYGATKLCADKLFVQSNAYAGLDGARFSCVRYGNVVGSRGSVIPLFLSQRANGVITVTDRRMTRFWITLEQGVDVVLKALALMHGGEIFVPKIPSMSMMDLVEAIAPDCRVQFTGIRTGEKLHETLVSADESWHAVELPEMFIIQPAHPWWEEKNWKDAKPMPDGFVYSSQDNPDTLNVEKLREMVFGLGAEEAESADGRGDLACRDAA